MQILLSSSYLHEIWRHNSLFMYVHVYTHTSKACLLFYTSLCSARNLTSLSLSPPQDFPPFIFLFLVGQALCRTSREHHSELHLAKPPQAPTRTFPQNQPYGSMQLYAKKTLSSLTCYTRIQSCPFESCTFRICLPFLKCKNTHLKKKPHLMGHYDH